MPTPTFTHDYVAFRNGQIVAVCVDDQTDRKWTAAQVADFIKSGCEVKHMSLAELQAYPKSAWYVRPKQLTLEAENVAE